MIADVSTKSTAFFFECERWI